MRLDEESIKTYLHRLEVERSYTLATDFAGKLLADRRAMQTLLFEAIHPPIGGNFTARVKEALR